MIAEAIAKILSLAPPTTFEIGGKTYSNRELYEVREAQERQPISLPVPTYVEVFTLNGFADLIQKNVENFKADEYVVQVVSEKNVRLVRRLSDDCGRRQVLITATPVKFEEFKFGQFTEQEDFIIAVNALFSDTIDKSTDKEYVLKIASCITNGQATVAEDDGIQQKVTIKAGLAMVENTTLKPTVKLAPFRTFPECQQPISEFVFRAKPDENRAAKFMLKEADGGKWRIAAIQEVARFLSTLDLGGLTIIS